MQHCESIGGGFLTTTGGNCAKTGLYSSTPHGNFLCSACGLPVGGSLACRGGDTDGGD